MITGNPVHTRTSQTGPAKDITPTNHQSYLQTGSYQPCYLCSHPLHHLGIDPEIPFAHERLSAKL